MLSTGPPQDHKSPIYVFGHKIDHSIDGVKPADCVPKKAPKMYREKRMFKTDT